MTNNFLCDDGLELQAITLGATSLELGCCIIKSFDIIKLKEILSLSERFEPQYILAVGYPKENVKIIDLPEGNNEIKYYRDAQGIHYVPKRQLSDLIIKD